MGTLYKEIVGYKKQKAIKIVLIFGFVILFINTVILISSLRNIFEEFLLVSYVLILLAAIGMAYSWAKGNKRYKYLIIDRELIIEKLSGYKKKSVLNINTKRIIKIEKWEFGKHSEKLYKQYNFLCSGNRSSAYNCIYEKDGKLYGFYFEPSTELYNKIICLMNYSKIA
jgi:hypothetical protein